jgi:hypothetical protein
MSKEVMMATKRKSNGQLSLPGMDPPTKGRRRYGPTARSSGMGSGPDLDTTSARRRIHEAVATFVDDIDDWEDEAFTSRRVAQARYSPSRRQLVVDWTNGRPSYVFDAIPPAVWTGFRTAGSAGQFVNHTLNTFPYRPYDG